MSETWQEWHVRGSVFMLGMSSSLAVATTQVMAGTRGVAFSRSCTIADTPPLVETDSKGLFGSGDIPKWLGIATEKLVANRLV
jgi:hypothetical protein